MLVCRSYEICMFAYSCMFECSLHVCMQFICLHVVCMFVCSLYVCVQLVNERTGLSDTGTRQPCISYTCPPVVCMYPACAAGL